MNKWVLRLTALAFAAALSGAVACSGTGGGCGGANTNSSTYSAPATGLTCGSGTVVVNNQCVVAQKTAASSGASSTSKSVNQ